ncbi:MAG: hypothetical protein ACT4P7_17305 [Gemmatimonadaceae bacterium]
MAPTRSELPMIMADVFKIVFLVVGILAVFVAYWLASVSLFPRWVMRASTAYQRRAVRSTLLGVLLAGPLTLGAIALFSAGGGAALLGALVASVPVLLALAGSAGFALRVGIGLGPGGDSDAPAQPMLRGGIVLALTFLLPIVGWFLVFPWVLISGVGAALLASRRSVAATSVVTQTAQ